jgi:hypothetical protein
MRHFRTCEICAHCLSGLPIRQFTRAAPPPTLAPYCIAILIGSPSNHVGILPLSSPALVSRQSSCSPDMKPPNHLAGFLQPGFFLPVVRAKCLLSCPPRSRFAGPRAGSGRASIARAFPQPYRMDPNFRRGDEVNGRRGDAAAQDCVGGGGPLCGRKICIGGFQTCTACMAGLPISRFTQRVRARRL